MSRYFLESTSGFIALALSSQALAQPEPAAGQDGPSANDIVVTAQKRTENVQDVPKSVSVASIDILEQAGATRLNDLSNVFPSITAANNNQNQKPPGIRGIITFANATSVQAKTGIIIDDIPQPTFSTLATELSDIERVELFPGPQSTLSGRNAAGGLINIVTRAPSDVFEAEFRAEQTTDSQTRVSGLVSGPIGDTLAFSVSGVFNKWRGPVNNIGTDNWVGGFNTKVVRAKLRWDASPTFSATLAGYYLQTDRETTPLLGGGPYIDVAPGATHNADTQVPKRTFEELYPGITPGSDNREMYGLVDGTAEMKDRGVSLRLDLNVGSLGTISSLTNYQKSNQPRIDYLVAAPLTDVSFSSSRAETDVDTKYWSQEVRLVSPGDQGFTYLLGAIYTDSDLFQPYSRPFYLTFDADRTSRIKSFAVFGRGTYELTDSDFVTGGLRYQADDQAYTWLARLPIPFYSENQSSYDFLAGELSYRHEFSRNVSAYATYSHSQSGQAYDIEDTAGAAPPGSGVGNATGPLEPLASEKVNAYELGFKSQLFDRRITLNVSVFRADYKNYQVQTIDASSTTGAPVFRILSIGAVRTQGVEVSTALRVGDGLQLGLGAIYNDAEIRDYPDAACYTRQTAALGCTPAAGGRPANQGNLAGSPLQGAPKFKLNASLDYSLPLRLEAFDVRVGGTWRHESSSIFSILQDPSTRQPSFDVVNLYAGIETTDGRYSAQIFVNNVLDEVYYTNISNESQFNARSVLYDRNSFRYGGIRLVAKL